MTGFDLFSVAIIVLIIGICMIYVLNADMPIITPKSKKVLLERWDHDE